MRGNHTRHSDRIKKSEFKRIFYKPDVNLSCKGLKLVAKRNFLDFPRFGVTFVRNYGNAVQRNYSKRIMKEIFRAARKPAFKGYDIIVVLYTGNYGFSERNEQFNSLIQGTIFD